MSEADHRNCISVSGVKEGQMITGYVLVAKVMDMDGGYYWATRKSEDINDMEAFGMAQDMANCFGDALRSGKERKVEGE